MPESSYAPIIRQLKVAVESLDMKAFRETLSSSHIPLKRIVDQDRENPLHWLSQVKIIDGDALLQQAFRHMKDYLLEIFSDKAYVNARNYCGFTPLSLLCESFMGNQNKALAESLLFYGADVNFKNTDYNGMTPLLLTIESGSSNMGLLKVLLQNGADVNARDKKGFTVLDHAKRAGFGLEFRELMNSLGFEEGKGSGQDFYLVDFLDKYKLKLNNDGTEQARRIQNSEFFEELSYSCLPGYVRDIILGLSYQMIDLEDIKNARINGSTLIEAAREARETSKLNFLEFITEIHLNDRIKPDSLPPEKRKELSEAFITQAKRKQNRDGQVNEMLNLIYDGADVNHQDEEGKTALHHLLSDYFNYWNPFTFNLAGVYILMLAGANPEILDKDGNPPRSFAEENHQDSNPDGWSDHLDQEIIRGMWAFKKQQELSISEIVKNSSIFILDQLRESGLDVNSRDLRGDTFLIEAVRQNNLSLASYFIRHGANPNLENASGNTPLHYAVENGNDELVKILLKSGSHINMENTEGKIPFRILASRENPEMLSWIIENRDLIVSHLGESIDMGFFAELFTKLPFWNAVEPEKITADTSPLWKGMVSDALVEAVENGRTKHAELLLAGGASPLPEAPTIVPPPTQVFDIERAEPTEVQHHHAPPHLKSFCAKMPLLFRSCFGARSREHGPEI